MTFCQQHRFLTSNGRMIMNDELVTTCEEVVEDCFVFSQLFPGGTQKTKTVGEN
jgi:hypothetical protein